MNTKKGFTLLELLIVIAILAILATAVVLVINPVEYLRQARDSQRMTDFDTLRNAIALYLGDVASPTLGETAYSTSNATCGFGTCTVRAVYSVDGNGWAAVALDDISTGAPVSMLPKDPTNDATYQYAYDGDNTAKTFELNARLESSKYRIKMTTDGGDANTCATYTEETCYYEIGTDPALDL